MRGVHVGKLPSVSCQERLPGHGRSKPTVDVSYGVEALFHPMLDYVFAFLGDSDINILGWQKNLGFVLQDVMERCEQNVLVNPIQWTDRSVWSPPAGHNIVQQLSSNLENFKKKIKHESGTGCRMG